MANNPIPYNTNLTGEQLETAFDNALNAVPQLSSDLTAEAARAQQAEAINRATLGTQTVNLLANNCSSTEVQGVTLTVNADGSITLNGTNTGSSVLAYPNMQTGAVTAAEQYANNKKWIPTGKYIMSISESAVGATLQMRLATEPNDAGTGYTTTTETAVEITDEHNYVWTRLLISSGASFDNVTIYPMIRPIEVTDSTYKPYKPPVQMQLDTILERIAALEAAAGITYTVTPTETTTASETETESM